VRKNVYLPLFTWTGQSLVPHPALISAVSMTTAQNARFPCNPFLNTVIYGWGI